MAQNGPVIMQAGKTYTITVTSTGFHNHVRVVAANGVQVAIGNNLRSTRLHGSMHGSRPVFCLCEFAQQLHGTISIDRDGIAVIWVARIPAQSASEGGVNSSLALRAGEFVAKLAK